MIDLHCHVLPGIDDGPQDIEESVVLARAAATQTRILVATPHVSSRYPNDAAAIRRRVAQLQARIDAEGLELELRAGAEVALSRALQLPSEELHELTLGGGPWLLVEPPFSPAAREIDRLLGELRGRGLCILLAHPERCPAFHRDPHMLRALVDNGMLTSLTAGSLVGRFGEAVRRFSLRLLREGLVHNVASDAHDRYARPPGMAAELDQAGVGPLADWLTRVVPCALLDGAEVPPPPAVALPEEKPQRRWRWARRRLTRAS